MSSEEQVQKALQALAEHDRNREAGPEVEARVMRGFRQARKQQQMRTSRAWLLAVAAAVVAALVLWTPWRAPQEPFKTSVEPVARQLDVAVAGIPGAIPVEARPAGTVARREIVTQFFLLSDSSLPLDRGQLVRVRVPASTMQSVGLPVNPERWAERVDADILVGEEGMARAIRFVGYEQ